MSRLPDQSLFLFYESDEDKEECEKPTEEVKRSEELPQEEAHKEQAKKKASKAALQRSPVLSKDGWERQEQEKAGTKRKEARRKVALRHGMELSEEEEESLPSGFDLSPLSKSNSDILAEASLPPPSLVPKPSKKAARKGDRVAAKRALHKEPPVSIEESTASTDILDGLSDAENSSDDDDTHSRKTQTSSKASNKASNRHRVLEKMETSPGKGKKRKTAENTGTSAVIAVERRKEETTGLLADNAPEATLPAYNSDDESSDFGEEDGEESPLIELSGPSFELPGSTDLDDDLADLQLPKAQTAVSEKETKTDAHDMDVDEDAGKTRATQTKKRKRNEGESEEEAKECTVTKAPLPAAKKRRKEGRKEEERASEVEENIAMDVDEGWRDDGTLEDSDLEEMVEESPSEVPQRSQRTKKPSRKAREAEKSDEEEGDRRKRKKPRKSIDTRELSGSSRKARREREREREREVEEEEEEEESSDEESFINTVVRPFSKKLLSKLAEKKRPEINSKLLSGFTFLFTSLDADVAADGALPKNTNAGGRTLKEQLRKLVTLHGGKVANRFVAAGPRGHGYREHSKHQGLCATVLLCPGQQQRTEKFLLALLHGTACLHYSWLVDCCERQTVVDYNADEETRNAYFVPLGLSLEMGRPVYGYEDEHTAVRQPPDIFMGARCEVVGSESAFVDFWSRTLKAAGAKVVKRLGEPWERDGRGLELVVTESDPTKYLEEQANALNLPVLSAEWVFQCLLARSIVPFFKGSPPEVTHSDYFEIDPPPNVRNFLLDIESDTEAEEKAPKTKRKSRER